MNHEIKSIDKEHTLSKSLQDRAEEGESSLKELFSQEFFQKRKIRKLLTSEQQAKKEIFKRTVAWLCETFPDCFDRSNPKPLKKRIEADIFASLPQDKVFSRKSIRNVLAFYVRQNKYHKALLENQHRFNLAGSPFEEISLADREHARAVLKTREETKALQQKNKNRNKNKEIPCDTTPEYNQCLKEKL